MQGRDDDVIDGGDRELLATIRRLLETDDLLHHGGIVATATIVSGGVNYAFQVFVGRALGPEQYGIFGSLFALFYLVNVLGRGIRFSASQFTAEVVGRNGGVRAVHRTFLLASLLFGVGLAVALVAISPTIAAFLGLSTPWLVVVVSATIPFALALRANNGALQGLQWFVPLGSYRIVQSLVKFGAGVALVLLGYGVYGAIGAIVVAMIAGSSLTTIHLRGRLTESSTTAHALDYRRVYQFTLPAVLAGFCLMVPGNVDVILVRHAFSSGQAGLYTAASVLGKIMLFVPMGISTALFPKLVHGPAEGSAVGGDDLFHRALLYSAIITGIGTLVYGLAPAVVLELFFGEAYVAAAPLLRWYGLAILAFVLAVVVLKFTLARERMRFVYVFAAVTLVEIGLIWRVQGSMIHVVQVIMAVNVLVFVYGLIEVRR